ncbi:peptidase, M23/M37 family [Microscilla marina ATCC 23134]|uniref:Peptidase, M23/M37 family n=2 Tax=Microscilla marina TaxID=1027 RepID=A1ZP08_MICM2|nr:peptidase, M23/M37 family [Microscilla marina ATCC 23134]
MFGFKYIFGFLLIFCLQASWAQVENQNPKGNMKIVPTPAKKTKKDTLVKVDSTKKQDESGAAMPGPKKTQTANRGNFNLFKRNAAIVREDSVGSIDIGTNQIVKISEEIKIDCVWIKAVEYYSVWNSTYINPYRKDAKRFRDTIDIKLYDAGRGQLWSAPLATNFKTSNFGYRWGRFHHGIDLNLSIGTPIYSVFDGIVRISAYGMGFGNYVVVRHYNGLETLYGHMSIRKVEVGQVVKAGQLIGLGGSTGWSTGPHLHFEVRYQGNSIDPLLVFDFSKKGKEVFKDIFTLKPEHFWHLGNKTRKRIYHQVKYGDTLYSISRKYRIPIWTLARQNKLHYKSRLKVGQRLIIR